MTLEALTGRTARPRAGSALLPLGPTTACPVLYIPGFMAQAPPELTESSLPAEPARRPQLGFVYAPPFRIQGISIAGEESVVAVPELDVCFDIGSCPKAVLPSPFVALTHGHMDHVAGIAYYFSQRPFQGMSPGTVVCPPSLHDGLDGLMKAWQNIERQKTPYTLTPLADGEMLEIKNNHFLRPFRTVHTVPSSGYTVLEKRTKLREELVGLPQEEIVRRKTAGEPIVNTRFVPLVSYTGDTGWGDHLLIPEVLQARVLITECTFMERGHRRRAGVGKHLHLDHVVELVEQVSDETDVVLTHLSRRTHMNDARKALAAALPADRAERVHLLMDNRTNRERFARQQAQAAGQ